MGTVEEILRQQKVWQFYPALLGRHLSLKNQNHESMTPSFFLLTGCISCFDSGEAALETGPSNN